MKNIDLALESRELHGEIEGVTASADRREGCTVTRIRVETEPAAQKIGKPVGDYVTAELFAEPSDDTETVAAAQVLAGLLKDILPQNGDILFCGLGNRHITPDSLGPLAANRVIATRHLPKDEPELAGLRPVSVIFPGVLSQTGMETVEILSGLVQQTRPAVVVTVDALAAQKLSRLAKTVQICNTGIAPGSGVGNHRKAINRQTLGCEVISIGVPLVVDGVTLCCDLLSADAAERREIEKSAADRPPLMVTHTDIDKTVESLSKLIALAFNLAVQPSLSAEDILSIMG